MEIIYSRYHRRQGAAGGKGQQQQAASSGSPETRARREGEGIWKVGGYIDHCVNAPAAPQYRMPCMLFPWMRRPMGVARDDGLDSIQSLPKQGAAMGNNIILKDRPSPMRPMTHAHQQAASPVRTALWTMWAAPSAWALLAAASGTTSRA